MYDDALSSTLVAAAAELPEDQTPLTEDDASEIFNFDIVRQKTQKILDEPLYWFPIRHHSPFTAYHVEQAIRDRHPEIVFMEAAENTQHMIEYITESTSKPPFAVYANYVDDGNSMGLAGIETPDKTIMPRYSGYYPYLSYSPEYRVLMVCKELGIPVVFVDLSLQATKLDSTLYARSVGSTPTTAATGKKSMSGELLQPDWSSHMGMSRLTRSLVRTGNYKNFNEAWDDLFESGRQKSYEAFRYDLAMWCGAVRTTRSRISMLKDNTIARERYMWHSIQSELQARRLSMDQAMMVCGGFHIFLNRNDSSPVIQRPPGTQQVTLVPFQYYNFSEASGYGAANRAPKFYERLFRHIQESGIDAGYDKALAGHTATVLRKMRERKLPYASTDVGINALYTASAMLMLRPRNKPTLDILRESLLSGLVKDDLELTKESPILQVMAAAEIGRSEGRVSRNTGQVPLVADFLYQRSAISDRMKAELEAGQLSHPLRVRLRSDLQVGEQVEIFLNYVESRRANAFLRRLELLGIHWCKYSRITSHSEGTHPNVITWVCAIDSTARLTTIITKKSVLGETVEAAALTLFVNQMAAVGIFADKLARMISRAVDLDFLYYLPQLETRMQHALNTDTNTKSLTVCTTTLLGVVQLARAVAYPADTLLDLTRQAYLRACLSLPTAGNCVESEQLAMIDTVGKLLKLGLGDILGVFDLSVCYKYLGVAYRQTSVPFMRGAFAGYMLVHKQAGIEIVLRDVRDYIQSGGSSLRDGGEYIAGVMSTVGDGLQQGLQEVVAAVDDLFQAASDDQFTTLLPRARQGFQRLAAGLKRQVADQVLARYNKEARKQMAAAGVYTPAASKKAAAEAVAEPAAPVVQLDPMLVAAWTAVDHQTTQLMESWL